MGWSVGIPAKSMKQFSRVQTLRALEVPRSDTGE